MNKADNARIIVADDDIGTCELISAMLRREDFIVASVHDGLSVLDSVREAPPDALLLDVIMPGMDGIEVCRRLKGDQRLSHVPILLITGTMERDVRLKGIEAGANDYLVKPLDRQEVTLRVKNAVRLKRMHDDVRQSLERLKELESLRDGLVHMIVHDLRVPLTVVDGSLQYIARQGVFDDQPRCRRMVDNALRSARSIMDIVNSLLDVSKLESGSLPIEKTEVDIVALVEESVLNAHLPDRDAPVSIDAPDEAVLAYCDPSIVARVILNLLVNALRYTPQNGEVTIAVKELESFLRVEVTDQGPGIPEEHRSRIFEKFGQVLDGKRDKMRSAGLGLAFCKLAVEAHGGEIGVDSEHGKGSTFWFSLPK